MTNYEKILSMDIKEMAEFFYWICHERDVLMIKKLNTLGIEAEVLELPVESVINHMKWLESEEA